MNLLYAYICRSTNRVFRTIPANLANVPAKIPDVLVIQVSQEELSVFAEPSWAWRRGFYSEMNPPNEEQSTKLKILKDRCFALESLYRNVGIWRQNFELRIPFNDLAQDFLYKEALFYLETKSQQNLPLLSQFSTSQKIDFEAAARLVQLTYEEKRACIVSTESFKIEWETRLLNSAAPLAELELLKRAYPLF